MVLRILKLFTSKATVNHAVASEIVELERARALQALGQVAQAMAICEEILALHPENFDAVILSAEVAASAGNRERAVQGYERAIVLDPTHSRSHYKLGNLLKDGDRLEAAISSYDRAIALDPHFANALCNRGVVLQRLERLGPALRSYDQAIALNPEDALAYYNRGAVLRALKRPEESIASLDRAIALQPTYAAAHCNRGILSQELKKWDDALVSYDRAIEINPDFAEAHLNRGNLLRERTRLTAALASYDRAIEIEPTYAAAHCNRGILLTELRQWDAALASINRAIELRPDFAEAYNSRGCLFSAVAQKEAALVDFDRAVAIREDYTEAICNRGDVLAYQKKFEAAIASYDRALIIEPDYRLLLGANRHAKMHICDWKDVSRDVVMLTDGIHAGAAVSHPFSLLALLDSPALHREAARIWVKMQCAPDDSLAAIPARLARQKIRIGYFSADFRDHPVALLAAELLESHDKKSHESIAFSFGPDTHDSTRTRIEAAVDRFIDVRGMADREIALLSRSLGIDIAIDLGGHTGDSRTGIFALRAAPIQANYLGYPGTMGADYIDYLIGDSTVVPEEQRRHYSEKIVYLPNSFMPHDSGRAISNTLPSRKDFGLPPSGFVFCCFNSNYKITPETFGSWMRILGRTGKSVLWLAKSNPESTGNLRKEALRQGIDAGRLIFADRMALPEEHLARHRLADLFLDTRPYNAHATALDALWAGLPVLTCMGEGFAGRVAASLLKSIDLPELVTSTLPQYEDLAVELAGCRDRLTDIRRRLAQNRDTTPLFDTGLLTRHLERAYFQMHERQLAGLPPEHIHVE